MSDKDLEQIKKKLNELDTRLTSLSKYHFATLSTLLGMLEENRIIDHKEFKRRHSVYKKVFSKIHDKAEFVKIIRQLNKKGKK